MIDLDDLERLADAAEWDPWDPWDVAAWHSGEGDQAGRWGYGGYITTEQRDFVAAANPSTVKALIARIRRLEVAAQLSRNVRVGDGDRFSGDWVAVPLEDFEDLRAALESTE